MRIAFQTLHEVCGKRQGTPSNTPAYLEMFKKQADVDAGDEKGSDDYVTALNKASL